MQWSVNGLAYFLYRAFMISINLSIFSRTKIVEFHESNPSTLWAYALIRLIIDVLVTWNARNAGIRLLAPLLTKCSSFSLDNHNLLVPDPLLALYILWSQSSDIFSPLKQRSVFLFLRPDCSNALTIFFQYGAYRSV